MNNPKIILLPNLLSSSYKDEELKLLPICLSEKLNSLDCLVAESEKTAKRYLLHFLGRERGNKLPIFLLNEHSKREAILEIINFIIPGKTCGLISDAGLPCIADPGEELLLYARRKHPNIEIEALMGPSSIILALMLSGLPSERFFFHGYLPIEEPLLQKKVTYLENLSIKENATQFFIEAPYRSQKMFSFLLKTLHPETLLCIAKDLTLSTQNVTTLSIKEWRKRSEPLNIEPLNDNHSKSTNEEVSKSQKKLTVFLFYRN